MWRMYRVQYLTAVFIATAVCVGLLGRTAVAQPPTCSTPPCQATVTTTTPDSKGNPVTQTTTTTVAYGNTSWQGLNWGIGLAADFDVGGQRVTNAMIDPSGIVRVTDTSGNVDVSFVLEAHYFVKELLPSTGCQFYNCNDIAFGPFVAVEVGGGSAASPTGNGPITGYALGGMVGLHHPDVTNNASWNFGIALRVDPKATVLADGVAANRPAPAGFTTQNLLKTEPRAGIMLLSSFSF